MGDIHVFVGSLTPECFDALPSLPVPEFDGSINTAAGERFPIWAECNTYYPVIMPLQYLDSLSSFWIPKADTLVITATSDEFPITADGH
jgi:hypothetical protein